MRVILLRQTPPNNRINPAAGGRRPPYLHVGLSPAAGYAGRWADKSAMIKTLAPTTTLTLVATACSPMYLAARPPVDISGYQGDGAIARLKHPINPGFKVDFAPFMLDSPYAATLRLDHLPKPRHDSPYELGLVVDLSPDELSRWPEVPSWLKLNAMGSISLHVVTRSGEQLLNLEVPIAGQYWTLRVDEPRLFAVLRVGGPSNGQTSRFPSDLEPEQIPSVLEVSYGPGPDSPSKQAMVRLVAGGED